VTFNKKAPQPKEGVDYGEMSSKRQTVICLPAYILPLSFVLVCSANKFCSTKKTTKDRTPGGHHFVVLNCAINNTPIFASKVVTYEKIPE